MITNEKFAEVLKSLTKEDFDAVEKSTSNLTDKFNDLTLREMFTEDELEKYLTFLESYADEVIVITVAFKFKEVFEEELCLQQQ